MMDENYYLTFLYNNTKINSPVRNKFAVLSYAETYPVLVQSLKTEDSEVVKINNQKEFHKILKELVNDDSVLRSVRSAMNQKEAKK